MTPKEMIKLLEEFRSSLSKKGVRESEARAWSYVISHALVMMNSCTDWREFLAEKATTNA
jgi:hypothetical protein